MARAKINLLINLPAGFFSSKPLAGVFRRLSTMATVRKRSWNTPQEIEKDLGWADAVLMWSWPVLTEELLSKAPRLRFAAHINAGQQGARACLKRRIAVSEARHGWSEAVAEMALTLMLSGLRRVSEYHSAMRRGAESWVNDFPLDIDPVERKLTGRTVGIIGLGGIGRRLAQFLAPFHPRLLVYDPFVSKAQAGIARIESLREQVMADPDNDTARLKFARAYWQNDQLDRALEEYRPLATKPSDVLAKVMNDLEEITSQDPESTIALELLAQAYAQADRPADALPIYQQLYSRLRDESVE